MKRLTLLILTIIPSLIFAQSFVFCPKIDIQNKISIEGDAYIVFKDSRIYEKKLKEKCSAEELINSFSNYINETFPNMNIIFLEENQYDKEAKDKNITFKIELKRYDATFYSNMYDSYSKFLIDIYDYRNGHRTFSAECNGKGSQFNMLGYKSGKIASNSSFKRAYVEFVTLFEAGIKGDLIETDDSFVTKADKLRELKKLLDEGILTQEEFESEKKKVLAE